MTRAVSTPHPLDLDGYRIVRGNVERDLRKKYPDADPAWMSREAHRYAREFARHLLPADADGQSQSERGRTRMTDTRKTEAQLREQAHELGYRIWTRRDDAGAVIFHVNHGGNHNHADGLRTLGQVQDWLGSAEPATDDCPLFDQEPGMEDAP